LCEVLNIEYKNNTRAKRSQLKELECFFDISKNKTWYTINKIYQTPLEKTETRGGGNKTEYIKTIELLILDLLVQEKNNGNIFLSRNKLLLSFAMINDNFVYCKERIPKLSQYTNIQQQTVEEWYLSTGDMLKRNLEKALDNLRSQALVMWSNELTVCDLIPIGINKENQNFIINKNSFEDEYGEQIIEYKLNNTITYNHREATKEEKKFILRTERETMESMGFTNKQEIVRSGMWNDFKEKVDNIILEELNIAYYYNSYKVICNEDHIIKQRNKLLEKLSKEEREIHLQILNNDIMKRLHANIEKKQIRAKKKDEEYFGKHNNENITRRIQEEYINDNDKLVDSLINKDATNIKKDVRKIKLT
jgi:hypothetical protein